MNLFEINEAIAGLKEKDDLDPDVLADTLESLEITRNEKLDGIASWIDDNKGKINWISEKIKQFNDKKQQLTRQNERLMDYLTQTIDKTGYKQIQTDNHLLKPRNYRASTIIENERLIPEKYKHEEKLVKIDKKAIYQALKDGKEVSGASLKPNRKTSIL